MDHSKELYGFPTSVNLKYFASNFQEKQREAKQKEKELANAAVEKEVLKIKESPWKIFTGSKSISSTAEIKNIEEEFVDNYYSDLLKLDYLLTAKGIRSHNFKLFRLLFQCNLPVEHVSKTPSTSDKPGVLNSVFRAAHAVTYSVKNKIENIGKRCVLFVRSAIFVSYGLKLGHNVQRLIIPLKDTSVLRETKKSELPNVYLLKKHSDYDLMFLMLSVFWSDLRIPTVFFNGNTKTWKFSIFEKLMFTLIDWKNTHFIGPNNDYERLRIQLEPILKRKSDILFCLEGDHDEDFELLGRIMERMVNTYAIPDVFLTTVNFSFEAAFNDAIENALLSNHKSSFDGSSFNHYFKTNLGLVRAKFGIPVSVKGVIESFGGNVLQKVTARLNWELSKSEILMSTNLVSFILLTKYRDGAKFNDLIREVDHFKNELNYRGKLVGFTGNTRSIVNHAINMLDNKIAMVQINNEYLIKPVLRLPDVLGLYRLSHSALNYFVLDASMMTCLELLFRTKLDGIFKGGDNLVFNYTVLVDRIEQLCEILQYEFNFNNPVLPLSSDIANVIFNYIEAEYFVKNEKLLTDEEKWGHRLAKHLESDDDDDYDYRSNRGDTYTVHFDSNGDLYSAIMFYKKSLHPILESYLVTIEHLKSLTNKHVIHSELIKQIFTKLKNSFEKDLLGYPESVSLEFVRNSIKLMEKWNVLENYAVDGIKVLFLSREHINEQSLCDIEYKLRSFL